MTGLKTSNIKLLLIIIAAAVILVLPFHVCGEEQEYDGSREKTGYNGQAIVELFAGTGEFKFQDGDVLDAGFGYPYGLAADKDGNLFVADSYNHAVRKIADGKVITVAGGFDSSGTDPYGYPAGGYIDGNAAGSRFNRPRGIAVDSSGVIYIADTENHSIRKIDNNKAVTLVGGAGAGYKNGTGRNAEFNFPSGIAIDKYGNIYAADTLNHCIRKISPGGTVMLYAGKPGEEGGYQDGNVLNARFNEPSGIAIDNAGNLYVADSGNQVIRKISGNQVTIYAGIVDETEKIEGTNYCKGGYRDGDKETALFNFPKGITVTDNGTVIVADTWNHRIRAIKPDGKVITIAGTGRPGDMTGPAEQSMFNGPADVEYISGYLYISDMWNNAIKMMRIDEDNLIQINTDDEAGIRFEPVSENIQVWIDGKKIEFPDVLPCIEDGMYLLPIRFVFEKWGADVGWDQEARTVIIKKDYKEVRVSTDEQPVIFKNGRTLVSTEFITGFFGFSVQWVPEYRAIVIVTH